LRLALLLAEKNKKQLLPHLLLLLSKGLLMQLLLLPHLLRLPHQKHPRNNF
jgi:hypothetical protein